LYVNISIIYADDGRVGRVFSGVYVFVCLSVFPENISKIDAAMITKLDIGMVHYEY